MIHVQIQATTKVRRNHWESHTWLLIRGIKFTNFEKGNSMLYCHWIFPIFFLKFLMLLDFWGVFFVGELSLYSNCRVPNLSTSDIQSKLIAICWNVQLPLATAQIVPNSKGFWWLANTLNMVNHNLLLSSWLVIKISSGTAQPATVLWRGGHSRPGTFGDWIFLAGGLSRQWSDCQR